MNNLKKKVDMIEIKQIQDNDESYFAAFDGDKVAGRIFYTTAGEKKMILDHTEVDINYRGKGIGNKILNKIVEYVRENDIKIIPLCPFAKSVFDKDKSIGDVLI